MYVFVGPETVTSASGISMTTEPTGKSMSSRSLNTVKEMGLTGTALFDTCAAVAIRGLLIGCTIGHGERSIATHTFSCSNHFGRVRVKVGVLFGLTLKVGAAILL
jgi:hypothetical protein